MIDILRRTGAVDAAEAWAARSAANLANAVENMKVDPTYPTAKGITDTPVSQQVWKERKPPGIQK